MTTIDVPNVNERERIPPEAIQAVADRIAEEFDPDKIILFGSYAYGDPKPWSDVDLLVVMEPTEGVWRKCWPIRAPSHHTREDLTVYGVQVRYPGFDATVPAAREAVDVANRVRAFVRHKLGLE